MSDFEHEAVPPPGLKRRIVRSLETRALLRRATTRWQLASIAAALVLLFGAGVVVGHRAAVVPGPAAGQRWILLLREGPAFQPADDESKRVAEYSAWAARLRSQHALELGEKLAPGQQLLGAVSANEAAAAGNPVTGFFVITAPDSTAAAAIAATCPHLKYGGWIVLRRIEPT